MIPSKKTDRIVLKKDFTNPVLEQLGYELLEWMDKKENVYVIDFLASKEIPKDYVKNFLEQSAKFKHCWNLALQKQEAYLIKILADKKTYTSGIVSILKEYHGWKDTQNVEEKVLDVSKENIDAILSRKFSSGDKFKSGVEVNEEGELTDALQTS